jgi:hypothetical protein
MSKPLPPDPGRNHPRRKAVKPKPRPQELFIRGGENPHVKLAAEYWLDVFTERLLQITGDNSSFFSNELGVAQARTLAGLALAEFESRWPGGKLP